mmetsp:Transcript_122710/g.392945  ORF Transcript_122710/g.392945 Transcript_122710/m.392945 type:complete len:284 (+) Transcript_122710:989-1840(+)
MRIQVHREITIQATKKRRRDCTAVRHVRLDAVRELVGLVHERVEGLQREERLEVRALHHVRLHQAAEAVVFRVGQLQRADSLLPVSVLTDGPVWPLLRDVAAASAAVCLAVLCLSLLQHLRELLAELAAASLRFFVQVAPHFLHLGHSDRGLSLLLRSGLHILRRGDNATSRALRGSAPAAHATTLRHPTAMLLLLLLVTHWRREQGGQGVGRPVRRPPMRCAEAGRQARRREHVRHGPGEGLTEAREQWRRDHLASSHARHRAPCAGHQLLQQLWWQPRRWG